MGGFSSIIGLSQAVANTLYDAINAATNAINTHKALSTGVHGLTGIAPSRVTFDAPIADTSANIANAFDNDSATFALLTGATAAPHYVTWDMGAVGNYIVFIGLSTYHIATGTTTVAVEVSTDNTTWKSIVDFSSASTTEFFRSLIAVCVGARYIRIGRTAGDNTANYSKVSLYTINAIKV